MMYTCSAEPFFYQRKIKYNKIEAVQWQTFLYVLPNRIGLTDFLNCPSYSSRLAIIHVLSIKFHIIPRYRVYNQHSEY